jgi:hypothetical protein
MPIALSSANVLACVDPTTTDGYLPTCHLVSQPLDLLAANPDGRHQALAVGLELLTLPVVKAEVLTGSGEHEAGMG